jgi:hypothetical protein
MDVTMLKSTRWRGETLVPGDTIEVDEAVARRWKRAKIADSEEFSGDGEDSDTEGDGEPGDGDSETNIDDDNSPGGPGSTMTFSQLTKAGTPALTKLAEKRGVDISSATTNKARAELIFADINKAKG